MSGLVALLSLDGTPVSPGDLTPLLAAGAHRGFAGSDSWYGGGVALGHLALHPEEAAEQPWVGEDGLVVVADCRLDEPRELARRLGIGSGAGGVFPSEPELVAAAYRRWGAEFPCNLEGDFGLVLWDPRQRLLVAARDRLGIKSLCWTLRGGRLGLASEAQQLVPLGSGTPELDEVAVADHLAGNFVDDGRTMFQGIHRLRAAHLMVCEGSGMPSERRYWDIDPARRTIYQTDEEYSEHFAELFERSVSTRLESASGPVGALLSGGLDSSAVVGVALQLSGRSSKRLLPIHFSFDKDARANDREYLEALESYWKTPVVRLDSSIYPLFNSETAVEVQPESPFVGWDGFFGAALQLIAAAGGKILLTGHGGDSFLQGSSWTYLGQLGKGDLSVLGALRRQARRENLPLIRVVYRYLVRPWLPSRLDRMVGRLVGRPRQMRLPFWIDREFAARTSVVNRSRLPRDPRFDGRARQDMYLFMTTLGAVGRAVAWQERRAAAFGVEVRHPFLDPKIAEYVLSIPPERVWGEGQGKAILRDSIDGVAPSSVARRVGKASYHGYVEESFMGLGRERIAALFRGSIAAEKRWVSAAALHELVTESDSRDLVTSEVWALITLELWLHDFCKRWGIS